MEPEYIEKLTRTEERSKSNTHRLDKLEPIVEEIHTMSKAMVQLTETVKHTSETVTSLDEKIDKMDSTVNQMKAEPLENYKLAKRTMITSGIGAIGGAAAVGFISWLASIM